MKVEEFKLDLQRGRGRGTEMSQMTQDPQREREQAVWLGTPGTAHS